MALFSQKKPAKKSEKKAGAATSTTSATSKIVLQAPRITEKAMRASEKNVYVFVVARDTSKFEVRDAVKALYGVTPVKVNIVNKAPRQFKHANTRRTRTEHGIKKAYVYLKKGDTISLI